MNWKETMYSWNNLNLENDEYETDIKTKYWSFVTMDFNSVSNLAHFSHKISIIPVWNIQYSISNWKIEIGIKKKKEAIPISIRH